VPALFSGRSVPIKIEIKVSRHLGGKFCCKCTFSGSSLCLPAVVLVIFSFLVSLTNTFSSSKHPNECETKHGKVGLKKFLGPQVPGGAPKSIVVSVNFSELQ
jgi:hypothetical protein